MTTRYLSGVSNRPLKAVAHAYGIGLLIQPGNSYHRQIGEFPSWAADNGAYRRGAKADEFDFGAWWDWLTTLAASLTIEERATCLFVAVPDAIDVTPDGRSVMGDADETLRRFMEWAPRVRMLGLPVALVGQPGSEDQLLPWDLIDYVFLGGHNEWKLGDGAAKLVGHAHAHGKPVHMGRVNSRKRFRYARELGCDTADGTFLAFGPNVNLPKLLTWFDEAVSA